MEINMESIAKAPKRGFKLTDLSNENRNKVRDYLLAVNGRSTAHTIRSFLEVVEIAEMAEQDLDRAEVKKSARVGCLVVQCNGGATAKSYKYEQRVTYLKLRRFQEGWRLMEARRATSRPLDAELYQVSIPAHYIDLMRRRSTVGFSALPASQAA